MSIVAGAGVLAGVLLLWIVPKLQTSWLRTAGVQPEERFQAENEARRTLAEILGGATLLAGLYFAWGTLNVSQSTLGISQQTLTLSNEGQITQRFTQAIELIGDKDSLAKRVGGVYALDRIAKDSEKDRRPVLEILTAYVRDAAPRTSVGATPPQQPRSDVQAVVTLLIQPGAHYTGLSQYIDLHQTNLDLIHFGGGDLSGAKLWETHLYKADFWYCTLHDVQFIGAKLPEAILSGAQLQKADLRGADLTGAHLEKAVFKGAVLKGASFKGAIFEHTHLEGTDLSEVLDLTQEQVNKSFTDAETKLPAYLTTP